MTNTTSNPESPKKTTYTLWSFFDPKKNKHRYILSLAIQYGWSVEHKTTGKQVADLKALDKWLRNKFKSGNAPVSKPLQDMDAKELSKTIAALENMIAKKY